MMNLTKEEVEFIGICSFICFIFVGIQYSDELAVLFVLLKKIFLVLVGKCFKKAAVTLYSLGNTLDRCYEENTAKSTNPVSEFEVMPGFAPYPPALSTCLRVLSILTNNEEHYMLEESLMAAAWRNLTDTEIRFLNIRTRESGCKSNFCYLLLDPRLTERMNFGHTMQEKFQIFIQGIFYIGRVG